MASLAALAAAAALADRDKLTDDQKIGLIRGLTAEFATVKTMLPRSRKPLVVKPDGAWDKKVWAAAAKESGEVARVGDTVQVTKVDIGDDAITLEINGGFKTRRKWYEGIQVGMGNTTQPVSRGASNPTFGTVIRVEYEKSIPAETDTAAVKRLLAPVLDFEKRTATEQFVETLPPEIQEAVKAKKVIVGMDRDQVILAVGRPAHKSREYKEGFETEDWVYGVPPGKVTFITFANGKVTQIKETYAGLGGSVAEKPRTP